MEIRVGAFGAGDGATAAAEGGGSGGIFCPWAAMAIGRANNALASANPFLMTKTPGMSTRDKAIERTEMGPKGENSKKLEGRRRAGRGCARSCGTNVKANSRTFQPVQNRNNR